MLEERTRDPSVTTTAGYAPRETTITAGVDPDPSHWVEVPYEGQSERPLLRPFESRIRSCLSRHPRVRLDYTSAEDKPQRLKSVNYCAHQRRTVASHADKRPHSTRTPNVPWTPCFQPGKSTGEAASRVVCSGPATWDQRPASTAHNTC